MKERGILFSGLMVRALLSNQKTMTRRAIKDFPVSGYRWGGWIVESSIRKESGMATVVPESNDKYNCTGQIKKRCPYGKPSDRLYVKEAHFLYGKWVKAGRTRTGKQKWLFVADKSYGAKYPDFPPESICTRKDQIGWFQRNSLFMPHWASRITLEITSTRVERLNDITEGDAFAEGVISNEEYADRAGEENLWPCPECQGYGVHPALGAGLGMTEVDCTDCDTQKKRFRILWESINGSGSWDVNPWVWVVEFKRIAL